MIRSTESGDFLCQGCDAFNNANINNTAFGVERSSPINFGQHSTTHGNPKRAILSVRITFDASQPIAAMPRLPYA
jgi:hypothetical protein